MITQNGTDGRIYGGDPGLVHIADGQRTAFGRHIADHIADDMRRMSFERSGISEGEPWQKPLCPGCYMVALFNAAVFLARDSGQSQKELARSMAYAFAQLGDCEPGDDACIESIAVKLDEGLPS